MRRSIRGAESVSTVRVPVADDTAILASTWQGAEDAIMAYIDVADKFGLTVNLLKTKLLVMGCSLTEEDMAPTVVGGDTIERVDEFSYLGSVVTSSSRIDAEVDRRLAGANRAFGALRHAVLMTATSPSQQSVRCTGHAYCPSSCMGVNAGPPCANS